MDKKAFDKKKTYKISKNWLLLNDLAGLLYVSASAVKSIISLLV